MNPLGLGGLHGPVQPVGRPLAEQPLVEQPLAEQQWVLPRRVLRCGDQRQLPRRVVADRGPTICIRPMASQEETRQVRT